jgi:hypothetical protein
MPARDADLMVLIDPLVKIAHRRCQRGVVGRDGAGGGPRTESETLSLLELDWNVRTNGGTG